MKTRHPLLPIAVVLATCLWTSVGMAQAVTMPAAASQESGLNADADIAPHGTGELPVTAQAGSMPGSPYGTQSSAPADKGSAIPRAAVAGGAASAQLREQALVAMETLREEIATLAALKHAQEALLAWNRLTWDRLAWDRLAWDRGRTEGGEAPVFLALALCAEPALGAWCPLLPATFGTPTPAAEESHDRD